jgi:1-acyl-sn-glycerol-3-phosphate acyltransferase
MLDPSQRTSRVRQSWRAVRIACHLARGLAITTLRFPRATTAQRREHVRRWSAELLELLAIESRVTGSIAAAEGNLVLLANHVSWLDIFVIDAQVPARFIAKSELARWPLVGRLLRDTETIFLERARKADMRRVNAVATEALARGDRLAVFPEGTTTDGTALLKFHGSLLQPVIDANGRVQPVALRYTYADGTHSLAPEYAGGTSFACSFWRMCGARAHVVEITALPPVFAEGHSRRELAALAEDAIRRVLRPLPPPSAQTTPASAQPAHATAPGTCGVSRDRRP